MAKRMSDKLKLARKQTREHVAASLAELESGTLKNAIMVWENSSCGYCDAGWGGDNESDCFSCPIGHNGTDACAAFVRRGALYCRTKDEWRQHMEFVLAENKKARDL